MKFDNMGEHQKKVFDEAKNQLSKKPWFKGVCTDNYPSEKDCKEDFEFSVHSVVFETAMWDDPDLHKYLSF